MSTDDIIADWIAVSNEHDTTGYLGFFTEDTVLDDTSVGEVFEGHEGLRRYFETYVVGYSTQTRLVSITPQDGHSHVVVDFTGTFPEGQIGGYFDITFTGDKISFMQADLLWATLRKTRISLRRSVFSEVCHRDLHGSLHENPVSPQHQRG